MYRGVPPAVFLCDCQHLQTKSNNFCLLRYVVGGRRIPRLQPEAETLTALGGEHRRTDARRNIPRGDQPGSGHRHVIACCVLQPRFLRLGCLEGLRCEPVFNEESLRSSRLIRPVLWAPDVPVDQVGLAARFRIKGLLLGPHLCSSCLA